MGCFGFLKTVEQPRIICLRDSLLPLVPNAASIPTGFFSAGTDVRQNWMEVHKETQTFASLRQTVEQPNSQNQIFNQLHDFGYDFYFFNQNNTCDLSYELKLFNASHIAAQRMVLRRLSHDLCYLSHVTGFCAKSQQWEPGVNEWI